MTLSEVGYHTQASGRSGSASRAPAPLAATGDVAVTGSGDPGGYHLYVTSAAASWRWRALATILPRGDDDQRWIGQQCLTGDGRTIVAVIAPWSANNSEAGMDSGALAYAVSVATGAVRPITAGVSLSYFDPGCGSGSAVALTSYLGASQRPTKITVYDATSGRHLRAATVSAEITSAVPVGGRILAAEGAELVDVTGGRATPLHRFGGQLADLIPSAAGGVDLLAQAPAGQMDLWHAGRGVPARLLASGGQASMRLLAGAGGRNLVANPGRLAAGSGLRAVWLPRAAAPTGASADGDLLLVADTAARMSVTSGPDPDMAVWQPGARRPSRVRLPSAAARPVLALPAVSAVSQARNSMNDLVRTAAAASADTTVPQCAVPRNDIFKQAWQPGSDQVRWAVNQAALKALSASFPAAQRPVNNSLYTVNDADYTPLPTLFPSGTWPLASLASGADPTMTVPPLVMYGILAQESNWDQASWHAIPGRSGNPLVADYYGVDSSANTSGGIDYHYADCGYGIAQVTSGMQNSAYPGATSPLPPATQVTLAVDYAANIAYSESLLQGKWNQLKSLGITVNDGDPTKIENWYAAIWAYNSGVHTGGAGQQGLGWFNNPANPIYPFARHTFLHDGKTPTLTDAATPQGWPYQEKVFGWMEVPLAPNGVLDYRGTYDWDTSTGTFLGLPSKAAFCRTTVNNCDPSVLGDGDPCPANDSSCWWSAPVRTVSGDCQSSCTTDTVTDAPNGHESYDTPGQPEPQDKPLSATCSLGASTPVTDSSGNLLPGTVIVDDEMIASQNPGNLTPNLMGCSSAHSALVPPASVGASFSLLGDSDAPIDASASPSQTAAIDLHQLGGGVGGHMFFTQTSAYTTPTSGSQSAEARGQWTVNALPASTATGTAYQIYAFIPDVGAATGHATYEISTGGGAGTENTTTENPDGQTILARTINQNNYTNQWVSLGYYLCGGSTGGTGTGLSSCTMSVTLRSATPSDDSTQGSDIAFSAVAFVPAPTGGYVALGDSYSSGEGVFTGYDDGTDVTSNAPGDANDNGNLCHVSSLAWPRLLAAAKDWPLEDLTCSGSNLGDLVGSAKGGQYYLAQSWVTTTSPFTYIKISNDGSLVSSPPSGSGYLSSESNPDNAGSAYFGESNSQLDLLRALHPTMVTLTIGGNDLGFAEILKTCVDKQPCASWFANSSGPDQIDKRIASLQPLLQQAYADIKTAAGTSNVYAITYPSPIAYDPGATAGSTDCTWMLNSDRQWLSSKVPELSSAIIAAAKAAGIKSIDISTLFNGHDACSGAPYANAPDLPVPATCSTTSCMDNWLHPNKFGYQAMEAAIASKATY